MRTQTVMEAGREDGSRRPIRRVGHLLVTAAVGVGAIMSAGVAVPPTASGAVLLSATESKWPTHAGYTPIPVCVRGSDSGTDQKDDQAPGLPHDTPPSLDVVIGQVRDALRTSWESYSSVRFVGWEPCGPEPNQMVDLLIHPDASNVSMLGYNGLDGRPKDDDGNILDYLPTQFLPWGLSGACIEHNPRQGRFEYWFSCAREYAIHEFGHVIGFAHEWRHPATPDLCFNITPDKERPLTASEKDAYFIPNAGFDRDSIMTYNHLDSEGKENSHCADVTGRRFGSPVPNANDQRALATVYPPRASPPETVPVGVIPDRTTDCPELSRVTIRMDDEDTDNRNERGGWTGAITSDSNTRLEFCRVEGSGLRRMAPPAEGRSDYAVLKLGSVCPPGGVDITRYHDNEENHNYTNRDGTETGDPFEEAEEGLNTNWMAGEVGPTRQNFDDGTQTELHWCLFPQADTSTGTMTAFPDLGFAYGVLAPAGHPAVQQTGYIRVDDEDPDDDAGLETGNNNQFSPSGQRAAFSRVAPELDDNTSYLLAKVARDTEHPVIVLRNRPAANDNGWYTADVTITWTCYDLEELDFTNITAFVEIGTVQTTVTTDGKDRTATGVCTDAAGNTASATEFNIHLDKTVPTIALRDRPQPNDNGWYNDDVTITWECIDWQPVFSGVLLPVFSSVEQTVTSSGRDETATGTCADAAGNSASATEFDIDLDKDDPTVMPLARPEPNHNGWYTEPVIFRWTCTDHLSGAVGTAEIPPSFPAIPSIIEETITDEGTDRTVTGTCADKADNTASDEQSGFDIDTIEPGIELLDRPEANANGWYSDDVTITWKCTDGGSGVVQTPVESTLTEERADQTASQTCTDKAGNTASATETDFDIDKTKPEIELLNRPAANANGWYDDDVTITWKCTDALSGVVQETVESTVTTEGADQTTTQTCTDKAGNTASATESGINIDKTRPSVQIVSPIDGATFELEQVVGTSYGCGDEPEGSGLASCVGEAPDGGALDTAHAGAHTFTVTARDKAGNESSTTVHYTVLKAPTMLDAAALVLELKPGSLVLTVGRVSARLTYGPSAKPAVGRRVVFSAGSTPLCSASTATNGTATCTFGLSATIQSALGFGYTATFAGDADLLPSAARGPLAKLLGWSVLS